MNTILSTVFIEVLFCLCIRLLDVQSSEGRLESEHIFYMVFEYMEQDLDHFIKQCPPPGLEDSLVKVCYPPCILDPSNFPSMENSLSLYKHGEYLYLYVFPFLIIGVSVADS